MSLRQCLFLDEQQIHIQTDVYVEVQQRKRYICVYKYICIRIHSYMLLYLHNLRRHYIVVVVKKNQSLHGQ